MAVSMCCFFNRDNRLQIAVSAVRNGDVSIRKASELYSLPRETIRRHVQGISTSSKPGPAPFLGYENEEMLKEACDELNKIGHGVSSFELRSLGEEISREGNTTKFKDKLPSRAWMWKYCQRQNVSLRQAENTSAARFNSETTEIKNSFYDLVEAKFNELTARGLTGACIYNADKTSVCVVLKCGKVVASRGLKQVRARTGGGRGENVTCLATVNANGTVTLPQLSFFEVKP